MNTGNEMLCKLHSVTLSMHTHQPSNSLVFLLGCCGFRGFSRSHCQEAVFLKSNMEAKLHRGYFSGGRNASNSPTKHSKEVKLSVNLPISTPFLRICLPKLKEVQDHFLFWNQKQCVLSGQGCIWANPLQHKAKPRQAPLCCTPQSATVKPYQASNVLVCPYLSWLELSWPSQHHVGRCSHGLTDVPAPVKESIRSVCNFSRG